MKKNRSWNSILLATAVGVGLVSLALPAAAKVAGQCALCHTMHNSQGGLPMAVNAAGDPQTAPNDVLLTKGCVACHTGTNDGTNTTPYVNDTTLPTYGADGTTGDTLAGGNFYWVAAAGLGDDATGHNVVTDSLAALDSALGLAAPGGVTLATQLSCAGTMGCHGDRAIGNDFGAIAGTHHADDSDIDGTTVAKSFRFLDGVLGLEDSDWEYLPDATNHNQYQGFDRTAETDEGVGSISNLCAACHQDFHNGAGSVEGSGTTPAFGSPWVRHPTDFDMGNTAAGSEYYDYGGVSHDYVVSAPVASAVIGLTPLSTVTFSDDTIVTCISCHRAHGTPNADLLRWDYSLVVAGGGGSGGCFECHTTKGDI